MPIPPHHYKSEVVMCKRAWVSCRSIWREPVWNDILVQILVVVANIQMGTLKIEVGKGSMRTAIGHGLLDPKA